jgi:microcystin degradation protein MlrC
MNPVMRIGVAGFLHESNTFLSVPTDRDAFEAHGLTVGEDLLAYWKGSHHEVGGFLAGAEQFSFDPVGILMAHAVPSGTVTADAFESIIGEMLDRLRAAAPLDGMLLALHGATVCESHRDADGEVAARVRQTVGHDVPIVMTLDCHANVSQRMIDAVDATVMYRSNPHLDQEDRGIEAANLITAMIRGDIRPVQALATPPMIIPIAHQHTAEPPAKGLIDEVDDLMQQPGILSASVALGFPYADVAEMGTSFLVVADGDEALARDSVNRLAGHAWRRREEFLCRLPTPAEAIEHAMNRPGPVILMDIGDNVGGGSAGDSTHLLAEMIKQHARGGCVVLSDPRAVAVCETAGKGGRVQLAVGGKTDDLHGRPIEISGTVEALTDGKFTEPHRRHGGWGHFDQGPTAVIRTNDDHLLMLTTRRMAPFSLGQITHAGIDPKTRQIIVAKGVVAPRAAYEPIASEIILVDTPGSTAANPAHFDYRHRRRPLYPLESDVDFFG